MDILASYKQAIRIKQKFFHAHHQIAMFVIARFHAFSMMMIFLKESIVCSKDFASCSLSLIRESYMQTGYSIFSLPKDAIKSISLHTDFCR